MMQLKDITIKLFPNISLFVRIHVIIENGFISFKYIPKALLGVLVSLILFPLEVYETLKYKEIINVTKIEKPPIFIIGFWRSGTTHLHNLMSMDSQFCYASQFLVTYPKCFLSSPWLKDLIGRWLPDKRLMDNMDISFDVPQEEEFAICNMSPFSFYHSFIYPRKSDDYFDKYIMFKNVSAETINKLKECYMFFLKKVAYAYNNQQIILKNPVNTARIKFLLEMFPDAKFIHIYRNPYMVYQSNINLYNKVSQECKVQDLAADHVMKNSLINWYKSAMGRYFEESKLVPDGNLVEVKYEDLIASPIENIEKVYNKLQLSGIDDMRDKLRDYLAGVKDYKCNKYKFTDDVIEAAKKNFAFTLDKWGYDIPVG